MSVVIGMNVGCYVMIAADTRITWYLPDGSARFRDEKAKIHHTKMGLIAGVGLSNLLDSVARRLGNEEVLHTDRIVEILREERGHVPGRWLENERVRNAVEHETCWMYTYMSCHSLTSPDLTQSRLRLAVSHPQDGYHPVRYLPSSGGVCLPFGVTPQQADLLQELLDNDMQPCLDVSRIQETISHNGALCAYLIQEVSRLDETVSPSFQLGVHVFDLSAGVLTGISDVSFDGRLSMTLRAWGGEGEQEGDG